VRERNKAKGNKRERERGRDIEVQVNCGAENDNLTPPDCSHCDIYRCFCSTCFVSAQTESFVFVLFVFRTFSSLFRKMTNNSSLPDDDKCALYNKNKSADNFLHLQVRPIQWWQFVIYFKCEYINLVDWNCWN